MKQIRLNKTPPNFDFSKFRNLMYIHTEETLDNLRFIGLRVVRRLSLERYEALSEISGMTAIVDKSTAHHDLDYLFTEYEERLRNSVLVFFNEEEGKYLIMPAKSRFTSPRLLQQHYNRAEKGLRRAFKNYKDAIFTTITLPPILPLVIRVPELNAFILLQESALNYVIRRLRDHLRFMWGKQVKFFTAFEYHEDARLHAHILVLGVKGIIDWSRKMGRKGEPALEYYARKFGLNPKDFKPKKLAKHVFTFLLDKWLTEFLVTVDNVLNTHFVKLYQAYKKSRKVDGLINEVHRIKNGRFVGKAPKDSLGRDAVKYVLKYLLKMIRELQARALGLHRGLMGLKLLGYWIFAKRFYTYSRDLLPPLPKPDPEEKPRLYFIGMWKYTELPEYVLPYYRPP